MRKSICAAMLILLAGSWCSAQQSAPLSPVVRQFVKIESPVIALTHVRVIDGTGSPVRENQTIVISGDKIRAIGDSGATAIPAGAKVLDLAGYTVIPGLVGMHDHMYHPQPVNLAGLRVRGELQFEQQSSLTFPRLYLAAGVTSLRTTASVEPYADLNLKAWIDAGKIPGPKLHVTGPYLEGTGNFRLLVHELAGPEDARKTVEFWADQGVTSFKAFVHLTCL